MKGANVEDGMPDESTGKRNGAQALVAQLKRQGVKRVFCVPGESYLAVLDALADHPDIQVIACRHEAGAANMAEAHAKLTGEVGVCFVTRGPGATHASIGVHTARQDSTPMILFIGQVALADRTREAFQEIDYRLFFGPIAKWAEEIDQAERVEEFVARGFATARQGRPGPVVLALPEDMLTAEAGPSRWPAPGPAALAAPTPDFVQKAADQIAKAKKPLVVLGGGDWGAAGRAAVKELAEAASLPIVLSFRRKDLLDNDHPAFVGDLGLGPNPKLIARIKEADLILAIGARLGENPTQAYGLFTPAETAAKLIHVHPDPQELHRVWPAALSAAANSAPTAQALAAALHTVKGDWDEWRKAARVDYEAWTAPLADQGAVNLSHVFAHMAEALPKDAIITNGAGNYAAWLHRFFRHRAGGRQLAPTSGAMGYGVPAAIAAKLAAPARTVIAAAGDGCFLMSAQELATAVQYGAHVIFLVVDNGSYGTIRMHQEKHYPGRVIATDLKNPDFAAYARAFGAWAETVTRTEDFPAALAAARAAAMPAVLHLKTSVDHISPGRTLAAVRAG
jgi:acetolactate synthase-1/2/3 large subunit